MPSKLEMFKIDPTILIIGKGDSRESSESSKVSVFSKSSDSSDIWDHIDESCSILVSIQIHNLCLNGFCFKTLTFGE